MQSFRRSIGSIRRHNVNLLDSKFTRSLSSSFEPPSSSIFDRVSGIRKIGNSVDCSNGYLSRLPFEIKFGSKTGLLTSSCNRHTPLVSLLHKSPTPSVFRWAAVVPTFANRCMSTAGSPVESVPHNSSASVSDIAPRIKFKRLDKTAGHIMKILDKEAVEEVRAEREVPDIKPGYIIQLKVVVPENKRRLSTIKGIVIARRNAGLNSTFRLRRLVAGVGVESLFPLYSPNIKEIKVVDKKKVRRAKLYYLRDKMNALKKH